MWLLRRIRILAPLAAGASLLLLAPSAHAGNQIMHPARVLHVDGPGLLTLGDTKRQLSVRLAGIDSPAVGECGAGPATEALKALVQQHPHVGYEIRRARGADPAKPHAVRPVRDLAGRLLVEMADPVSGVPRLSGGRFYGGYELASDLVDEGWARDGEPIAGTIPPVRGGPKALTTVTYPGFDDDSDVARTDRGVWALCGGHMHLAAGLPTPPIVPAAWDIDPHGSLVAVGGVAMSRVQGTRLRTYEAAFPDHELDAITGYSDGALCLMWVPSTGISIMAEDYDGRSRRGKPQRALDCGRAYAITVSTEIPGVPVVQGGTTGDTIQSFLTDNPNARLVDGANGVPGGMYFGPYGLADPNAAVPLGLVRADSSDDATIDQLAAVWVPPFG